MTDAEIFEVVRNVASSQALATIALIDVIVVSLHNSGAMEKTAFVEHLRETLRLRAGSDDKVITSMLEKVITDLAGGDGVGKPSPDWFKGVIQGGKPNDWVRHD